MKTHTEYLSDCNHILAELQNQIKFIEQDIRKQEEMLQQTLKLREVSQLKHPNSGLKDLYHKYTIIKEVKYTLDQAKRTLLEYKNK